MRKLCVLRDKANYEAVNKAVNERYPSKGPFKKYKGDSGYIHTYEVDKSNRVLKCVLPHGYKHPDYQEVSADEFIRELRGEQVIQTSKAIDLTDADYRELLTRALSDIENEVVRAKSKFPNNFHNLHEGYAVLLEEVDELWDEIKKNQKNYDPVAQRKEAVQAAAMICRILIELL